MDKNIKLILAIFFAVSFFTFGWLSHTAYKPVHRIEPPSVLDKIKKEKILNVVLLNSPSTYYIGSDGPKGFEYDLLKSFHPQLTDIIEYGWFTFIAKPMFTMLNYLYSILVTGVGLLFLQQY